MYDLLFLCSLGNRSSRENKQVPIYSKHSKEEIQDSYENLCFSKVKTVYLFQI